MHEAKNTVDGGTITASQLRISPRLEEIRVGLRCVECDAEAFFRNRAKNGRTECFGARPHRPGCALGTTREGRDERRALVLQDRREMSEDEFSLIPVQRTAQQTFNQVTHDPDAPVDPDGRARRSSDDGPTSGPPSIPRRSLSTIHRMLRRDQKFRTSRRMIDLPDGVRRSVRTACVESRDVVERHRRTYRIYWGTVRYAQAARGAFWLNTARGTPPTVVLEPEQMAVLMKQKSFNATEELEGASFAAWAKMGMAEKTGRFFLHISELEWFDLRLNEEDEGFDD
jgi:hypothetical protein